jgi:transposase
VGRIHRAAPRRQSHAGGDKLFVDYAGDGVAVADRLTGEIRQAQIFVAVLGASNFTYAEATWTQGLADWIGAHTHAFAAIDGVPRLVMPDNTKVAVIKACLYDPQINRTYAEMAAHYDTAILPARPYRPRDKAKVELGVLLVERWLLGRLRHRTFFSLDEVNAAIREFLTRLNEERPIRRLGVTRRKLLEELDRPALKPLPAEPYVFAEWRVRRVGIDYHVEVDGHYYSVPHRLARSEVDVRITARTVEIFAKGTRVAAHQRMSGNHKHTTVAEHMPSSHRRYADWTIDRIRQDAALIGPNTAALCELILEHKPHPEQGFRACLGILRLLKPFGIKRLEAASARAIDIGAHTYGSVKSILDHNLDRHPAQKLADGTAVIHSNIRGPRYYN